MTVTISRLYNSYPDAQAAIKRLEAAGVDHGDISVLASNADGWYKDGRPGKPSTFPDRDLDGTVVDVALNAVNDPRDRQPHGQAREHQKS